MGKRISMVIGGQKQVLAGNADQQNGGSDTGASRSGENEKDATGILACLTETIISLTNEYKTSNKETRSEQQKNRFWIKFSAWVVFVYTTITAFQWCALRESNRINREALISVQRAFVSLENIQARATQDAQGNVTTWIFQGQWRNSGATPTQTVRQYCNYRWQPQPFPDTYDFPDLDSGKSTTAFIAPKDAIFSHRMTVPVDVLREVQEGKKHLYFWGWAAYRDVFQNSKTHLTEFCREVTAIEGSITKGGDRFAFVFTYCPTRNCVDESCKDYAEVEKKLNPQ